MRVIPSMEVPSWEVWFWRECGCVRWAPTKGSSNDGGVEVGRWCGVASPVSMMMGLSGMVQLSLGDECNWMDERGVVACLSP